MGVLTAIPEALLTKTGMKPNTAKLVVYGAFTVVAIIGVVIVVRQAKKFLGKGTTPVDKHDISGAKNITKDDAQSIADRIWNNMNSNFISSFGSIMTDVPGSQSLTFADKQMIYNAFGKHSNGFPFYTEGDLYFWLDRKVKFGVEDARAYWGY
jgi:hypothetical protein